MSGLLRGLKNEKRSNEPKSNEEATKNKGKNKNDNSKQTSQGKGIGKGKGTGKVKKKAAKPRLNISNNFLGPSREPSEEPANNRKEDQRRRGKKEEFETDILGNSLASSLVKSEKSANDRQEDRRRRRKKEETGDGAEGEEEGQTEEGEEEGEHQHVMDQTLNASEITVEAKEDIDDEDEQRNFSTPREQTENPSSSFQTFQNHILNLAKNAELEIRGADIKASPSSKSITLNQGETGKGSLQSATKESFDRAGTEPTARIPLKKKDPKSSLQVASSSHKDQSIKISKASRSLQTKKESQVAMPASAPQVYSEQEPDLFVAIDSGTSDEDVDDSSQKDEPATTVQKEVKPRLSFLTLPPDQPKAHEAKFAATRSESKTLKAESGSPLDDVRGGKRKAKFAATQSEPKTWQADGSPRKMQSRKGKGKGIRSLQLKRRSSKKNETEIGGDDESLPRKSNPLRISQKAGVNQFGAAASPSVESPIGILQSEKYSESQSEPQAENAKVRVPGRSASVALNIQAGARGVKRRGAANYGIPKKDSVQTLG
eukprot:gnl/MRDRNA2_/MRDRNA2_78855_c0_seq2.p1 gnl/MRDRNA2_/MRDRNA2_78855_c0~~gnl/MRDRNA2_/MRDRNA2_78855_c0_seq2.p1  ORF type:complete len:561 (+),score=136.91 gnl/MRDRNA2_/MRDRNA2_78855_c0_seq2:52-1683(+)